MRRNVSLLAFAATACVFPNPYAYSPADQQKAMAEATAQANAQVDATMVQRVDKARAEAQALPGAAREASRFALELKAAHEAGTVSRGKVAPGLVEEALAGLEQAAKATKDEAPQLYAVKGKLLVTAGRTDEGVEALRQSMAKRPNLYALVPLLDSLDKKGDRSEVAALCKKTRAVATTADERYAVLDAAVHYSHAASVEGGLSWAGNEDITFYKQERARLDQKAAEENAAWRQKQEADRAKMMADFEESRRRSDDERRCKARCDAQASTCKSHCGTGGFCNSDCLDAKSACYRSCR